MKYSFHPKAEKEFIRAANYYEKRQPKLGSDFSAEVYRAIQRILAHPKSWPFVNDEIRRSLVRRYPYGILYHYNKAENEVFIVAVMHLHREPNYWKHRY